jgi:hypothetical protein
MDGWFCPEGTNSLSLPTGAKFKQNLERSIAPEGLQDSAQGSRFAS